MNQLILSNVGSINRPIVNQFDLDTYPLASSNHFPTHSWLPASNQLLSPFDRMPIEQSFRNVYQINDQMTPIQKTFRPPSDAYSDFFF